MHNNPNAKLHEAAELLRRVDTLLAEWLTDNTEDAFEEEGEVDEARGMVQDAVELLDYRRALKLVK